ncbi:MAG: hypothetical protein GY863_05250 [bacterium]|nr:hypothetical protein [bacterium]
MKDPLFSVILIIVIVMSCTVSVYSQGPENIQSLKGPYLGQKPPELIPIVFAPNIISNAGYNLHGFPAFSPDGMEVYLPVIPPEIISFKSIRGIWSGPEKTNIPGRNVQAPSFSQDGKRFYFQAAIEGGYGSLDIWYVDMKEKNWSKPINFDPAINTSEMEGQPSFTSDGTIYYAATQEGSGWNRGIYRSRMVGSKFTESQVLNGLINTQYIDVYPFIAPDESFLLFSSSRPSMDEQNLRIYVSFRSEGDIWSKPVNLNAKMNFDESSRFPYLSPDGKYLFFQSAGRIYWVDAAIINKTMENK